MVIELHIMIHSYSTTQLTLKTICVRMESIDLNLHTDVLIGNIQICVLGYILQLRPIIRVSIANFQISS